jgi:hypothetical protein
MIGAKSRPAVPITYSFQTNLSVFIGVLGERRRSGELLVPSSSVLLLRFPNALRHGRLLDAGTDPRFESAHQFPGERLVWLMRIAQNGPESLNFLIA